MEFLTSNWKAIALAITGVATLVLIIKNYRKIVTFLVQVKQELSKVSWSSRQELISSTFLVIGVTFIMSVFIGIIDILLSRFLSLIFR